jgi:uncharacterized membrane protein YhaH (DUF805 family)
MGSFGIVHWLFLLLILLVPFWKIVARAGYSGAWSLLLFVPVVNVVALWVFASSRWPNDSVRT